MAARSHAAGWRAAIDAIEGAIAEKVTAAMRDEAEQMKGELREQVVKAGLSRRLANTWRGRTYPQRGDSLTPAAFLFTKAPDIIRAFSEGPTIVPVAGGQALAIPTESVPRVRGRRGASRRMTPEEVEVQFNQDLILLPRGGRLLAFVDVLKAKNGKGLRPATKGRVAQGRKTQLVLMFTFVRSVRAPRLIAPRQVLERAEARLARRIGE